MSKEEKVFNKLLNPLSSKISKLCKYTNEGYKYNKKFNFENHIKSMLFLQLSGGESLRDFDMKYRNHLSLSEDFEIPSYAQLSRLNAYKNVDTFKDVFEYTLTLARKELGFNFHIKGFKDLVAIDSSVVSINKGFSPDLYFQDNTSAIRISTAYSYGSELPLNINIVHAKIGERRCIDNYTNDTNAVYVFDKGYNNYSFYDELTSKGVKFITRLPSNAVTEQYSANYTDVENLFDLTVTLGTDYSKNKTNFKYREIENFHPETGEEFRLITNIFDISPTELISLYKKRWEIENFFKWIKQHLTIKHWLGHSLNAISIQIYCALIIYILLLLFQKKLNSSISKFNLLRKFRSYLLEKFDLEQFISR